MAVDMRLVELEAKASLLNMLRQVLFDQAIECAVELVELDNAPASNGIHLYPEQRMPSLEAITEQFLRCREILKSAQVK